MSVQQLLYKIQSILPTGHMPYVTGKFMVCARTNETMARTNHKLTAHGIWRELNNSTLLQNNTGQGRGVACETTSLNTCLMLVFYFLLLELLILCLEFLQLL